MSYFDIYMIFVLVFIVYVIWKISYYNIKKEETRTMMGYFPSKPIPSPDDPRFSQYIKDQKRSRVVSRLKQMVVVSAFVVISAVLVVIGMNVPKNQPTTTDNRICAMYLEWG